LVEWKLFDRATVARRRGRLEERVVNRFFRCFDGALEQSRHLVVCQLLGREPRRSGRATNLVTRRDPERIVAASVRRRRSRAREAHDRTRGESLEITIGKRCVRRDDDDARTIAAGAGRFGLALERVLTQFLPDGSAEHLKDPAEVRLHENADSPAAQRLWQHTRRRSKRAPPSERYVSH